MEISVALVSEVKLTAICFKLYLNGVRRIGRLSHCFSDSGSKGSCSRCIKILFLKFKSSHFAKEILHEASILLEASL